MKLRKELTLFIAGGLLVTGFFFLPQNRTWLKEKVFVYWFDFQYQRTRLSLEQRKIERYGTAYTYSKKISRFFEQKRLRNSALVLLPPEEYFKKHGLEYAVPEPAVFYYLTGLKTVWPNSSKATRAGWYVYAQGGQLKIDSVADVRFLEKRVNEFKQFPIPL